MIDLKEDYNAFRRSKSEFIDDLYELKERLARVQRILDTHIDEAEETNIDDYYAGKRFTRKDFIIAELKREIDPIC